MTLTPRISNHNFYAFLWHAAFLAFAKNFMDVDTVLPAMIIESGGGSIHIGIMTVIILGGSSFTQLFFAPYLSNWPYKKRFLLTGINSRILSLLALGLMLIYLRNHSQPGICIPAIFLFITLFSLGGAFTTVSYNDILGKAINEDKRKTFFSAKQIISGIVFLVSAFIAMKILTSAEYPVNYAWLFFTGATLLLIASAGFWKIKESLPSMLKMKGFKDFMKALRTELRKNRRLLHYLGFINTQGVIISFLPFVMLYAKELFDTQSIDTGNFLLFKVIGIVSVSIIVLLFARHIKYNFLLYLNVVLSILLALTTLIFGYEPLLRYFFIMGGVSVTLYNITMNGLLLEVSDRSNRALYTGFAGAGHIIPAIFPLAGSWVIDHYGFRPFFLIFIFIILLSLWFIPKIGCTK